MMLAELASIEKITKNDGYTYQEVHNLLSNTESVTK